MRRLWWLPFLVLVVVGCFVVGQWLRTAGEVKEPTATQCQLGMHDLPHPDDAWMAGWPTITTEVQCLRCGRWFSLGHNEWGPTAAQRAQEALATQQRREREDQEAAQKVETWLSRGGQKRVVELPMPEWIGFTDDDLLERLEGVPETEKEAEE